MHKKHPSGRIERTPPSNAFALFDKPPVAPATHAAAPPKPLFSGIVASRVRAELTAKLQEKPQRRFSEEQRRSARAPVDIPVEFIVGGQAARAGRMRDLSKGGLQLIADRPIPPGTPVRVTFDPSQLIPSRPSSSIAVDGKIVRMTPLRSPAGHFAYGVAFNVGDANSERIRVIVLDVSLAIGSSLAAASGDSMPIRRSI